MIGISMRRGRVRASRRFRLAFCDPTVNLTLERRELTVPAFFRAPVPWVAGGPDNVLAQVTPNVNPTWIENGEYVASRSAYNSNPNGTYTGLVTAEVIDVANPAAPANPVGAEVVSINSATSLSWAGSTGTPFGMGTDAQTQIDRAYRIADTVAPSTGWIINEVYHVDYAAPSEGQVGAMFLGMQTQLNVPNLQLQVGGTFRINTLNINGTNFFVDSDPTTPEPSSQSGSFTLGASTITYSVSTASVHVTRATNLAELPMASNDPWNGIDWTVRSTSSLVLMPATPAGVTQIESELSTHYGASFS